MSTLAHPPQTVRDRFTERYSETDEDDETLTVEDLEVESSLNDKSDEWVPKKKSGQLQIKMSFKLSDLT